MITPSPSTSSALRALERREPLCGLQILNAQGQLQHSDRGGASLRDVLSDDQPLIDEVRRLTANRVSGEAQLALPGSGGRWLQLNLSRLGEPGANVAVTLTVIPTSAQNPRSEGAERLTRRERQVAELAAQGLANSEIARELQASPNTIKQHLANAYRKTGVSGREELAALLD